MKNTIRLAVFCGAGLGAVVCAVAGQTWLYEHVERSASETLGDGYVNAAPHDASVPLAVGVVAAAITLICGILVWQGRRWSARTGRALTFVAVAGLLVGAASFCIVVERTDWLRGINVPAICQPASAAASGSVIRNGCVVAQPPSSGLWILAAIALGCITTIALPTRRTPSPPRLSRSPIT